MANYYDQPAQARFMNTYVPIPFDELYRLGASAKADVEKATADLSSNILKWSEFKSPSAADTKRFYDLSIGSLKDTVNELVSNPDALKTTEGRYKLQSKINNLDYATLSNIKLSAENLNTRAKVIAEMQSLGKYNKNWDNIDISNYDTARQGVMNDLAPIEYQNARQLSEQFYSKLQPGRIGTKRDKTTGLMYDYTGNTVEDLKLVADTYYNDMVNTPQGQMMLKDNLTKLGVDPNTATLELMQQAQSMFKQQIVDSNMDRTLRPRAEINPYYLQTAIAGIRASARKGKEPAEPIKTLHSLLTESAGKNVLNSLNKNVVGQRSISTDAKGNNNINYNSAYLDYLRTNAQKYPNNPVIREGYKNAVTNMRRMDNYTMEALNAYSNYLLTGSLNDMLTAVTMKAKADKEQSALANRTTKFIISDAFKRGAGKEFGSTIPHNTFLNGVNNVMDALSFKSSGKVNDMIFDQLSNNREEVQDKNGGKHTQFNFPSTKEFILPETLVELSLGKKGRTSKRGAFSGDQDFPLRTLIETGKFSNVKAIPTNEFVSMSTSNGVQFGAKTKLRIPVEQVQDALGTGMLTDNAFNNIALGASQLFWGSKESTNTAIKRLFGGRKVEEKVGDDDVAYYEIDAVLPLPEDSNEWWLTANQIYQGSKGIGGSSQAKAAYGDSAEEVNTY